MIDYPVIDDVLKNYNLQVEEIEEYSSFYKLKTNRGTKILRTWNDVETLDFAFQFRESLAYEGFRKIDRFIRTNDGQPYILNGDQGFVLTDWIEGKIPVSSNPEHMKTIGKTLAEFHQAMVKIKTNQTFEPWSHHFKRGLGHLMQIEKVVSQKQRKTPLDDIVLKYIPSQQAQMRRSIEMSEKLERTYFRNEKEPGWCLGNVQLNRFRIDRFEEGWIFDLGLPIYDLPAYDLAKMVAHVYQRNGFQEDIIYKLLDAYQEKNPLEIDDKKWILTYLSYPHDLWKFLYIYFIAKVPQKGYSLERQYQQLVGLQINTEQLYQVLYVYFQL
ncbi:phosphotransferase [Tepidibacillus sp. HK-1]|uniref:phosphotransferase n=1 Tax=Tepidibacillus sp. HK-1 TaxID=1883407 RepID=UPI0008530C9E|nr:phosphotransferase [Tepidibacillus sp. HK-1]GBF10829.1 spore coat protein I [Tepidibacillus sp. HK-1]